MAKTTSLGGPARHITVGKTAHGLMMMTLRPVPVPDQQAFDAIIAGVDALPEGAKMVLNSGEFYDMNRSTGNLELLSRFYEKYPEYAEKTFLMVKGANIPNSFEPDNVPDNVRRSVDAVLKALRGKKKIDLFETARVDPKVPYEETITLLSEMIHPIVSVEIEVSPWSYDEKVQDVIATAKELGIVVVAYAPLGRGFLTGEVTRFEDLGEGDMRRFYPRFQPDVIEENLKLVRALETIAAKKGVTPAQLSIGWVSNLGPHVVPLPGSSHRNRNLENIAGGDLEFTAEELKEIVNIQQTIDIKGHRYPDMGQAVLWG